MRACTSLQFIRRLTRHMRRKSLYRHTEQHLHTQHLHRHPLSAVRTASSFYNYIFGIFLHRFEVTTPELPLSGEKFVSRIPPASVVDMVAVEMPQECRLKLGSLGKSLAQLESIKVDHQKPLLLAARILKPHRNKTNAVYVSKPA